MRTMTFEQFQSSKVTLTVEEYRNTIAPHYIKGKSTKAILLYAGNFMVEELNGKKYYLHLPGYEGLGGNLSGLEKHLYDHLVNVGQIRTPDPLPEMPNGFTNWHETHFEISSHLTLTRQNEGTAAYYAADQEGSAALYVLAIRWTNEFEEMNKGREWDGEFFEEIDDFCNEKDAEASKVGR